MLSLIIITFNSRRFIKACLDSVFIQDFPGLEVIIVDNGSNDGTVDFIKGNYRQAILIENEINFGACRARNQGIEASSGEWVLTLDCDTVLEGEFLKKMMECIKESDTSVGMFGPKILNADKKTIYSCGIYLSWLRRFYDIGQGVEDSGQFDAFQHVFGICSACAFYKRAMLEDIKENTGYFDERFFFLVEDLDLAWRAQKRGWKAEFHPESICYHSGDSSVSDKKMRQYLCFRNRYYSIVKNEGLRSYFTRFLPLLLYDFPRALYLSLTNPYFFKGIKPDDR